MFFSDGKNNGKQRSGTHGTNNVNNDDTYMARGSALNQSMFDIFYGAKVVSGPAPRPLPQLPIVINSNNEIVANGDFDGIPGPLPGGA